MSLTSSLEEDPVLREVNSFIGQMRLDKSLVLKAEGEALAVWKDEDNYEEQNRAGQDLIRQYQREDLTSIILTDGKNLPVLLITRLDNGQWDGLAVDPRLRQKAGRKLTAVIAECRDD